MVDVATGEVLLTLPAEADTYPTLQLSPDGRYASLSAMDEMFEPSGPVEVYDVDTGSHVNLDGAFSYSGWSPSDQLFVIEGKKLTACEPDTGECTVSQLTFDVNPNDLKLGGFIYES